MRRGSRKGRGAWARTVLKRHQYPQPPPMGASIAVTAADVCEHCDVEAASRKT